MKPIRTIVVAGFLAATVLPAAAFDISGAGATFPYPIYAKWADAYKKETGLNLNYQSIGSGGGIKQIENKTVTFGASDVPLKGPELEKFGLVQFPMVMGANVPVVNLEGIKAGELDLDGPTLAAIFLGTVKSWDDPAIKKLNPNVKLPAQPIVVVHRSDGSGTTFNFVYYLSKVSPKWKSQVGAATSVEWPAGIGSKGNEGVSNNVRKLKARSVTSSLPTRCRTRWSPLSMMNKDGKIVEASGFSIQAAAANADWELDAGLLRDPGQSTRRGVVADGRGDVHPDAISSLADSAAAAAALKFFAWAYAKGDKMADELDYVPMPKTVVAQIEKMWASEIKDSTGKPLHTIDGALGWGVKSARCCRHSRAPRRFIHRSAARSHLCGGR